MRNLGKLILALVLIIFINTGYAQNFLENGLKSGKKYVLLAHPTTQNLETIHFLVGNNILQLPDIEFIGVYSSDESYDYKQSIALIQKPEMNRFHLQELDGEESAARIYQQNEWTKNLQRTFRSFGWHILFWRARYSARTIQTRKFVLRGYRPKPAFV